MRIPLPKIRELIEAIKALIVGPYTSSFPKKPHIAHRNFRGQPKYDEEKVTGEVVVEGIIEPVEGFQELSAFAHEKVFYKTFFWNIPKNPPVVNRGHPLFSVLLPEWERLERTADTTSYMKKESRLCRVGR